MMEQIRYIWKTDTLSKCVSNLSQIHESNSHAIAVLLEDEVPRVARNVVLIKITRV